MAAETRGSPNLSAIVATRRPFAALAGVLGTLVTEVDAVGGEVVVVSGAEGAVPDDVRVGVRYVSLPGERDIMRLRARGLAEARGAVVAIGEDHAFPLSGWATAIVRAHQEHPDTPVVLGALVNSTNRTSAARANFLSFAAPFTPPTLPVPPRPPPISTVTIKRSAVTAADEQPGMFETFTVPRLWEDGCMVCDDRIRADHRQDFGIARAMWNGFSVARASYGYARPRWSARERRHKARWALRHILQVTLREARAERGRTPGPKRDLMIIAMIGCASTLGAVTGSLVGAGRAANRSA